MKPIARTALLIGTCCVMQFTVRSAFAQVDINFAAPNVMLLVDTSGSMEYVSTSSSPTNPALLPNCSNPGTTTTDPLKKSRWVDLLEVLTGPINNYSCMSMIRSSVDSHTPNFVTEYSLDHSSNSLVADYGYPLPYNRPISGNCVVGPGALNATNTFLTDSNSFNRHLYNAAGTNTCTFSQSDTGILGAYSNMVRFGLMTFDTKTDPRIGYSGTSAQLQDGVEGTWSYFVGSTSAKGKPTGCTAAQDWEVGARNAAAPPWEGRMVAFGPPSPGTLDNPTNRADWIRNILLSTRPFGATPIAGMLDDAEKFLFSDTTDDPLNLDGLSPIAKFGPQTDPYVSGRCRKNFVILLSDGEPNLDLRSNCSGSDCPYRQAYDIATSLRTHDPSVQTFVVGFSVSQVTISGTTYKCRELTSAQLDPTNTTTTGLCGKTGTAPYNDPALKACCALDQIAYYGGTTHAYFADNQTELSYALSNILSQISSGTTSRTWPVMSGSAGDSFNNGGVAGYRFYTSFKPRLSLKNSGLWSGVIERQRFVCKTPSNDGSEVCYPATAGATLAACLKNASSSAGDEFADNVNSDSNSVSNRKIYTVIGDDPTFNSTSFIRPNLKLLDQNDGAGLYSGVQVSGTSDINQFPSNAAIDPLALKIDASTCSAAGISSATDCRKHLLAWLLGGTDGTTNGNLYRRCSTPGLSCSLIADVLHSTPVVVNRPMSAPRDATYQVFANAWRLRPLMLYTSTNDGLLHAFKVAANNPDDSLKVDTLANNELWAFIPPAVLPSIKSEYPGSHKELLDGAPVVADVVATQMASPHNTYGDGSPRYYFERSATAFASATMVGGNTGATTWRTVLVQGINKNVSVGGYFALDITNPSVDTTSTNPYKDAGPGPRFLWQLTDDTASASGRYLFGPSSGTPLIATLFFAPGGTDTVTREIAVAILPGGSADPDGSVTPQDRKDKNPSGIPSAFPVRQKIAQYKTADLAARSLTIVRLDTGEIIRTFRQSASEVPIALQGRVNVAPLDSPITGQPVAYPAMVGSIADRVFVGDRDGALWRVDLSSTDPSLWTMKMFFDGYPTSSTPIPDGLAGQPIVTQPQLSVDSQGRVTVAFSTGNQDTFSANSTMHNYVWSLTESVDWTTDPSHAGFAALVNWYRKYNGGEVPVGPLQLFGSGLYFATYIPAASASGAACSAGSSTLWGMHYTELEDTTTFSLSDILPKSRGGKAWLPTGGDATQTTKVQSLDSTTNSTLLSGATIFGVSVAQVPSCFDTSSPTDSFFGSTIPHTTMPGITPASYQLVVQTGASNTPGQGLSTNVSSMKLPTPTNAPRVASWAAIME